MEFCQSALEYCNRETVKNVSPKSFKNFVFDHEKMYPNLAVFLGADEKQSTSEELAQAI
jgi:hypothetical protein